MLITFKASTILLKVKKIFAISSKDEEFSIIKGIIFSLSILNFSCRSFILIIFLATKRDKEALNKASSLLNKLENFV